MSRLENRRVESMWRRKDKEAIKDHTARMTGDRSEEAVQDAPNIITLADFKKKK